jgi:VCBS repeat-containing protein
VDDSYLLDEDSSLVVVPPGVLINDFDVDGDLLTTTLESSPSHGTLILDAEGGFTFTPTQDYYGEDSFAYTVSDGSLQDTALVTLDITPVNDAPLAAADVYTTSQDTALVLPAPGVLANDSDIDGDELTAILVAQPGTAAWY